MKKRHENDIDLAIYIMENTSKKLYNDSIISSSDRKYYYSIEELAQMMEHHQDKGILKIKKVYSNTGTIVLQDKIKNMNNLESQNNNNNSISDDEEEKDDELSSINILEKEKEISDIIKLYELIINLNKYCPKNFIFIQNIINIGKFIEKENNFNPEIDDIIQNEIILKQEEEKKAIKELKSHYKIKITNEEKFVTLKGEKNEKVFKWLANFGFKLISKIRFKNLIELNLSRNGISNIEPLDNMALPHLEIINLSDNLIEDIPPLANINSYNLEEINLDNNKIRDLRPFLFSKFSLLKIFIVSNNEAINNTNFKDILRKYKDIIYYQNMDLHNFCQKYKINHNYKDIKLELSNRRKRDILIDLYLSITFPNNIEALFLDDNKLRDVSLLARLPLYNLKKLDLSFNLITNIKFLLKICYWRKLDELYLNDNKINDISPLKNLKIRLKILTLKNNYLDINDEETKNILNFIVKTLINDLDDVKIKNRNSFNNNLFIE